jgi:hypothetical protein
MMWKKECPMTRHTNMVAREVDCMVVVAFVEKDGMVLSDVVLCWRIVIDTSVILKSTSST